MHDFKINHLDHVGIRVKDLEASANWYHQTLGLKIIKVEKWNPYPIFLVAGKTGIALFPLLENQEEISDLTHGIVVDHFAFNVNNSDFELAKKKFKYLNIEFTFKDHYYFHSLYIKDLDNHVVELTTLVVEDNKFYSNESI